MTTFTGSAVNVYGAIVVAKGLEVYAKTGMKVNRAYTPANMMKMATQVTGKKFKARDYLGAAEALRAWAQTQNADAGDISAKV